MKQYHMQSERGTGLLVPMFKRKLENCNVTADETIVLMTDVKTRPDYVEACFAGAELIGAEIMELKIPYYGRNEVGEQLSGAQGGMLELTESHVNAMKSADFVFDFTGEGFIHVPERDEIADSGTRVLRAGAQPPFVLRRMMPWSEAERKAQKARVNAAADRLDSADEMRITRDNGTDLTMEVESESIFNSYGFADEPGKWDVWGQNFVANFPSNVTGTIVCSPGDYNVVPFHEYYSSTVEVIMEDEYVVEINGDGKDAELMRGHLSDYDDPDVFSTSHFGWGLHDKGKFYDMAIHDRKPDETGVSANEGRSWAGNVLWSTGPNPFKDRYPPCHYDIACKDCNVYLDGEPVVREGEPV